MVATDSLNRRALSGLDRGSPGPASGHAIARAASPLRLDVDFSLAIHNRTGKYFIGRDVLALLGDRGRAIWYGPLPLGAPPSGLLGRALGRLQLWQVEGQALGTWPRLPRRRRGPAPLLHLDPFTTSCVALRRTDAVVCHDVGPLTHPDLFEARICRIYRSVYARIAEVGPHMIYVSHASRQAFEAAFPRATPLSSRIIYPALRVEIGSPGKRPTVPIDGPFLLTVGSLGARKNQERCIAAFARSGLADRGVRYVICGGREAGFEPVEQAARVTAGVVLLPYVSDEELAWLYRHALGFVLASLLEGFGIPVAEAIAQGLVSLVSRGGVLEEVAGSGALAVDPADMAEIANGMIALCAMIGDEREARLRRLTHSIERFTSATFDRQWSAAIDAILKQAVRADPIDDPAISRMAR